MPQRQRALGRDAQGLCMLRTVLSDAQWALVEPLLPGKRGDPGRSGADNRLALEAVLWVMRTGSPWRDLPSELGKWCTAYQRFRRWSIAGVFERLLEATQGGIDFGQLQVDGTFVKAHQHAAGARTEGDWPEVSRKKQAIGRSRGGLTTNIVSLADRHGRLVRFNLAPGNEHEGRQLLPLVEGLEPEEVLADKAYDSHRNRWGLVNRGIKATIPPTRTKGRQLPFWDQESYKQRHVIENFFSRLKQFRGVATRYCKLAERFRSLVCLAAWYIATRV